MTAIGRVDDRRASPRGGGILGDAVPCGPVPLLLQSPFWHRALDQSGLAHSFFWRIQLTRQEGTLERVRSVAARVTADRRFELVDVEMKRAAGNLLVRLYVDKPGGIGLDDLQSVSEEVSAILDAEDPIEGH